MYERDTSGAASFFFFKFETTFCVLHVMCVARASGDAPGWDSLAGYDDVKQEIEDTLVMPLRHPVSDQNRKVKYRYIFQYIGTVLYLDILLSISSFFS